MLCILRLRHSLNVAFALATFVVLQSLASAALAKDEVDFNRDILPVLSDRCFFCHGPQKQENDLRLDRREVAIKEGAIEPGKPDDSELVARIFSDDPDERMPPPESKLSLTAKEKDNLRKWIASGAEYKQHWAFVPLPKTVAAPKVKDTKWARGEIDRFVSSRLEPEGLTPSPEATREKLIRRLSFDLTGLPPTPEEIDAFLADKTDSAYEKLVDRLLASTAYGERMATEWLDVARYSDTYGYQVDRDRFVWPWRDWVIKAFNENLRYDKFITWQLAGDLLPGATDEQIVATTFNRLHPQKVEGGSTPEEFRVEYVADRSQTVGTAFLGLSLQCARCHDHKYDPISQREYYQLYAFFNNIDEAGLYSYFTNSVPTPTLRMTNDVQKKQLADAEAKIKAERDALARVAESRRGEFDKWLAARPATAAIPGRVAALDFENFKSGANKSVAGKVGKAVQLTGDDAVGLKVGNFSRDQPFSVSLWMNTPDEKERAVVFHRSRAWTDAASRGYQLLIEDGMLSASLIHFWPGNAIRVRTTAKIPTKKWIHVTMTYDGSSRATGLRLYIDGKPAAQDVVRDNLYKNITGGGGNNIAIGERFRDRGFKGGMVDEFHVYNRELVPIEVAQLHDGTSLAAALAAPADKLTVAQRAALFQFYLTNVDAAYRGQLAKVAAADKQRSTVENPLTEIMVMRDMPKRRQTHLLKRGAYDAPGAKVEPETPAVFPAFPKDAPRNRLGLAQWLTLADHPLTARVTVNRYWQMCFGEGLVRSPEEFGQQGQVPTHPRMLDWLARDFVDGGWDVKRLLKQMVMSATYRQQSRTSKMLLTRDPHNELLARGPMYRLPAEMIRDNALATSGLLVNRIGGVAAKPYEVAVSFKPVGRDKGQGLYRRSLYTYWKRTGPAPVMMALDAAKRDVCVVKRERTASPLQAFVLLNDPQFVEAARMLAQRMIAKHGDDTGAVIAETFRRLTSRTPNERETKVLTKLYDEQFAVFTKNPARAEQFLKTGDTPRDKKLAGPRLAALAVLASTLMNYDECVMKR